jgi:hypothetical protein
VKVTIALVLAILTGSNLSFARPEYQDRVPNARINACITCHQQPTGGPGWNPFGLDFRANVFAWNQALAGKDSDSDGYTNGVELGDPEGTWQVSNPQPGNPALVSKPGDPTSTPPVAIKSATWRDLKQ